MSAPVPQGDNWKIWGESLRRYLQQRLNKPEHQVGGESAKEDGVIMWDRTNKRLIVSKDGVWEQIPISSDLP